MTDIPVTNASERQKAHVLIDELPYPFTLVVKKKGRSLNQNALMWKWMQEAASQLKENTADGYQSYCKLHFGVPILRGDDDDFRESYDEVVRPLDYELKLKLMAPPFSFPVTSLMNKSQMMAFMDEVYNFFKSQNVWLTEPER